VVAGGRGGGTVDARRSLERSVDEGPVRRPPGGRPKDEERPARRRPRWRFRVGGEPGAGGSAAYRADDAPGVVSPVLPAGGRRRRQQQRGPEGRWRPRPAAGAAGRLRLELWQEDDETREEPEGLHDADDDEGVRPDRVEQEPDKSREIAERESPPEGVLRGSVSGSP